VDFVSYYIEIAIMIVMFLAWKLIKRTHFVRKSEMDLRTDRFDPTQEEGYDEQEGQITEKKTGLWAKTQRFGQWVFL
jgi:AAT family amino acid transporter